MIGRQRITRPLYAGLAMAGTLLAVAACSPTPPERPAVDWTPGAPAGEFEDSEWVVALRAADLAISEATNDLDFTSAPLEGSVSKADAGQLAVQLAQLASAKRWTFAPGPTPMIVLSVDEKGDDQAFVEVCRAKDWYRTAAEPTVPSTLQGETAEYNMIRGRDGAIRGGIPSGARDECDLGDVSVGLFEPQPDMTREYSADDVKGP